jgi:hypothetical protein
MVARKAIAKRGVPLFMFARSDVARPDAIAGDIEKLLKA